MLLPLLSVLLTGCAGEAAPPETSPEVAPEATPEAPVAEARPEAEPESPETQTERPATKAGKSGKGGNGGTAGAPMCQMMRAQLQRSFSITPAARDTPDCEWEHKATLAELRKDDAAYSPHTALVSMHNDLMEKGWTEFTEVTEPGKAAYEYSRGNLVMANTVAWTPTQEGCEKEPVDCGADAESLNYTISMTIRSNK